MNFSLLQVDSPNKLKRISKNKISFFKKEQDVSLFHFNEISDGLFHAVYTLQDEYKVSTRKLGEQHNYVYSSLINFFFLSNSKYAFIEYINKEYQAEIIRELEDKTNSKIKVMRINNKIFNKLFTELIGNIKQINYTSGDGELLSVDYADKALFNQIIENYIVDDITILYQGQFVRITNNGRISVNNSDENYVINFTKRVLDALRH